MIGRKIKHYEILEKLGAGGMGEVYKAFDTKLRRPVAVKRMRPDIAADPERRKRFMREAQSAAGIGHPCVAQIHEILEENGELLMVMEYIEGRTLQKSGTETSDLDGFLSMAEQCVDGLAAAHEHGVIHRDIKPGNIMVTSLGRVKLLDFGLAYRQPMPGDAATKSTVLTEENAIPGTLAYMAPEVLSGKPADPRSDIFSLGLVFYERLTGRHPFQDVTAPATVHRILGSRPAPVSDLNPHVPEELERIIMRMLEKDPAIRYANAADLLADLRSCKQSGTGSGRHVSATKAVARRRSRYLWALAALALVVALVLSSGDRIRDYLSARWGLAPLPENPTLAIMPLAASGVSDQFSAFAGGLTEVLSERLSQISAHRPFGVVPRSLARARRVAEIRDIGMQLGANLALSGRLVERESDVQVELALIDGKTGRTLRRNEFSGSLSDPMSLDLQLAEKSCELLGFELDPRERRELAEYGTSDPAAYQRYLRGLGQLWYSQEPEHEKNSTAALSEAVDLDPGFAQAHTAMGNANLAVFSETGDRDLLQAALSCCLKASGSSGELAGSSLCLGEVYLLLDQPEKAVAHLERAKYLSPRDSGVLIELGGAYHAMGRQEDAERVYREAAQNKPDYWINRSVLGAFYFGQSRLQEAEREFKRVTELAPVSYRAYYNLCAVYGEMFRWDEMQKACERSLQIREQGAAYTNLATAYFFQNRYREAAEVARKALLFLDRNEKGSSSYLDYGNLAEILYWAPGERPNAAEPYRKALEGVTQYLNHTPRDLGALGRAALYQAMLGNGEKALACLQSALKIGPDNPETLFKAALVFKQLNQAGKSLDYLQLALEKGIHKGKARNHPIFQDLRNDPRFQALIGAN